MHAIVHALDDFENLHVLSSNISAKMEAENSMEATKVETNEVVDPIPEHEPSNVDVTPKVEFMFIFVIQLQLCIHWFILGIQLQLCIYWFILMHMSLPTIENETQLV